MSRYLLVRDESYRVDLEGEAEELINELKQDSSFELKSYSSTKKTTKTDEYYIVKAKKVYNNASNPV